MAKHVESPSPLRGIAIGIVVLFTLLVVAYVVDGWSQRGEIPRGTSIGGVAVGGRTPEQAAQLLEADTAAEQAGTFTIRAGELTTTVDALSAGLTPDWPATFAQAGGVPWNPLTRVARWFVAQELPIVSRPTEPAFSHTIDTAVKALSTDPVDGQVHLTEGTVETVDPIPGQRMDPQVLGEAVKAQWLNPRGVTTEPEITRPRIDTAEVEAAATGPAAQAVAGDVTVTGNNDAVGTIPTGRMGEVVTFVPSDPASGEAAHLVPTVNREAARAILAEGLAAGDVHATNAQISFATGAKVVTPEVAGIVVDWDATIADLDGHVVGELPKGWAATYKPEEATYTAAQAENATFDEVVGEFTTSGYAPSSGVNIGLTARLVDGAVVSPGDTFSLNGYTGPRGAAQGFVEAGVILNGHSDTAVGGGISQFATTLYNAAYFAGMEDVAHTNHSYYISRYPAGREATVYEGVIDLQFKNTSPYPVMINASMGANSVTVQLMGVKMVSVESVNGGRWAYTDPETMTLTDSNCSPSSGAPGFTTSDTRIVSDLQGNELSRRTTTTVYDPSPIVRCS
ncbi:MAG: VanW family protein [Corynebacterium sp.]|nr:VanW family protein [Corynebacterium sp.]